MLVTAHIALYISAVAVTDAVCVCARVCASVRVCVCVLGETEAFLRPAITGSSVCVAQRPRGPGVPQKHFSMRVPSPPPPLTKLAQSILYLRQLCLHVFALTKKKICRQQLLATALSAPLNH